MTSGKETYTVKRSVVWGKKREEFNRWRTEDIHDGETTLYKTAMVDILHYAFVKTEVWCTKSETGYANFEKSFSRS